MQVGGQGFRKITLHPPHIANLIVANGKVALPFRVARVACGKCFGDAHAALKGRQGPGKITLRQ